jgi:hypothetical protein
VACQHLLTYSVALSPRANCTDWATATCRRNLVPTFVDRGVSAADPPRSLISVWLINTRKLNTRNWNPNQRMTFRRTRTGVNVGLNKKTEYILIQGSVGCGWHMWSAKQIEERVPRNNILVTSVLATPGVCSRYHSPCLRWNISPTRSTF